MADADVRSRLQEEIAARKKLQQENAVLSREKTRLTHENEELVAQLRAQTSARERLETLARTLSQSNKDVLEQAARSRVETEEKAAAMNEKVQQVLADVQTTLNRATEERAAVDAENERLRTQIASLIKTVELTKAQMDATVRTKELELQLADAKLKQAEEVLRLEGAKVGEVMKEMINIRTAEAHAREEANLYRTKYGELQQTMSQYQAVFDSYKKDIESTSKLIKDGHKERTSLVALVNEREAQLQRILEERTRLVQRVEALETANTRVGGVCRNLQTEVRGLRDALVAMASDVMQGQTHATAVRVSIAGNDQAIASMDSLMATLDKMMTLSRSFVRTTSSASADSTKRTDAGQDVPAGESTEHAGPRRPQADEDVDSTTSQRASATGVAASTTAAPQEDGTATAADDEAASPARSSRRAVAGDDQVGASSTSRPSSARSSPGTKAAVGADVSTAVDVRDDAAPTSNS